jgi:phosphate starvation-inducible protein PhoH and related proteins
MEGQNQKRVRKNPIKFSISLNEEQKLAKEIILTNKITVLRGGAGSGKTLLSTNVALDLLFNEKYEKIILTRPVVTAGEEIGFLKGNINQKMDPFSAPIYDNMYRLYNREIIDKRIAEGVIEIIPLAFMRGRNFTNSIIIVDESQNITHKQMELLLGRMCTGSKMILTGDTAQIDLKEKKQSGFDFICKNFKDIKDFAVVTLLANHRDPIVEDILKVYNEHRD